MRDNKCDWFSAIGTFKSFFDPEILDQLVILGSKGMKIELRTASKNAKEYIINSCRDSNVDHKTKLPVLISPIKSITIDILIVDSGQVLLLYQKCNASNGVLPDLVGFATNSPALASFYNYLYETLP